MANRILLVDDEEGIRKVLTISLEDGGYQVLTAANGEEALAAFRSQKPEIVLTDIKMPGMDGIELLQKIKEESPETEIIMITGHGDLELAIRSLQCEAADFITKPINDEALEVALKRAHEKIWLKTKVREYTEDLERLVSEKTRQLVEAERLAAIGQTVATLAHAIKNIIGGLKGGMYVLEKGMELDNGLYRSQGWEMLKGNVDKIKNLALDLLSYAKEREPDYQLCDPNEPLRDVYDLMQTRARECGVELKLEACENLDKVPFDPEGIHCCLLNLVSNALDACSEMECVNRPRQVVLRSGKAQGWGVEYQVQDNGCGLDEETRSKVFRAFFSTKGTRGTGLGLMITKKILNEHRGSIEMESERGIGTKFTVRLPC
jgi:signal transduction histidine kinase